MHRKDKEFIIRKAASMSIYSALQLVNQDALDTVTWQQICDINKRPARGRTPQWFFSLTDIIQKAPNLKNYCMTDKAPFDSENRLENDGIKRLEIKLVKVKGHSGVKGNEEANRVAKNDTNKLICIKIRDLQQKDLIYNIYWDGIRVDRHIRKFIDNLCESTLDAAWSLNHTHRSDLIAQHQ
ncbi:hypothetical protein C1646_763662 [Rhizophagus diaphanus]|nr:hypothetical protein C1646_763662 [Rhizophagus diaphanus] [Rhizophagus sp. MUCL 43196]